MITIAIPSFNRANSAASTIRDLAFVNNYSEVQLLLINNGSTETSYAHVQKKLRSLNQSKYVEFRTNYGFAESFLRLFEYCESDYLLSLSDEDALMEMGFESLITLLRQVSPTFVSLRKQDGRKYKEAKSISLGSIKGASSYISGLIFKMDNSKRYLNLIKQLCAEEEFARLYPQVILAWALACEGRAITLNSPRYFQRDNLETSVSSGSGTYYWHPTERVFQYLSSLRCLHRLSLQLDAKANNKLVRIEESVKSNLFGLLFDSVKTISPDILVDLTRSSYKTSIHFEVKRLIKRIYSGRS